MNISINRDYSHEKAKVHADENFTGVDSDGQGVCIVFYEFFIYREIIGLVVIFMHKAQDYDPWIIPFRQYL